MSPGAVASPPEPPVRFAALRYPTFRNFWLSNTISSVGNSMEIPIRTWLIWTLSGSPLMLALSAVAHWAPFFFLSLYAGVAADRVERRHMLAASQTVLLGTTLGLAVVVITGTEGDADARWFKVWCVIALTFVHGVAETLGSPARLSLVSDIVQKGHVMNAVALNSTAQQIARFVGPAIGGMLVALIGMGGALVVNSATFLPYILVIMTMSLPAARYKARAETMWRNLSAAWRYMRQNPSLLALVVVIGIPSIFASQPRTLMPVFAGDVLHVGPTEYGLLLSATGLGSLVAGGILSWMHHVGGKGRLILGAAALSGVFTLLFAASSWYHVSLLFLVGLGVTQVIYSALANTALQISAPDDMRGRVMGFFTWSNSGLVVVGSLEAGFLAEAVGVQWTMAVAGIATVLAVPLAMWLAPGVRRVD